MTPLPARRTVLVLLLAALAACGGAAGLYAPRDSAAVARAELELVDPTGRRVPLRVTYPESGTRLPVVLFSHGAYSSKDDYDAILDGWAAAGYVVLAPTHPDSTKLGGRRGVPPPPNATSQRLIDLKLALDTVRELPTRVPALAGRVDGTRVAATGHSYGGWIAQTLGGASYFDPATNATVTTGRDARVSAVVVFAGPGRIPPVLRTEDWQTLKLPTLVTVGTQDLAQLPGQDGYRFRREPFDLAPPGDKYLLVQDGADHYLGGRVGRDDLPRAPQGDAYVAEFLAVTTAFLDAYLREDRRAREFLAAAGTEARAIGEHGKLQRK